MKNKLTLTIILSTAFLSGCTPPPYTPPVVYNHDTSTTIDIGQIGYIRDPRTGNCFAETSTTAEPGGRGASDSEGLALATVACTDAVLGLVPASQGGRNVSPPTPPAPLAK